MSSPTTDARRAEVRAIGKAAGKAGRAASPIPAGIPALLHAEYLAGHADGKAARCRHRTYKPASYWATCYDPDGKVTGEKRTVRCADCGHLTQEFVPAGFAVF